MHIVRYIRCRNCGKYIPTTVAIHGGYCSEECALKYDRCINCGRYFPKGSGYKQHYCSRECSIKYKITNVFNNGRQKFFVTEESA